MPHDEGISSSHSPASTPPSITGAKVDCVNGKAADFPCSGLDLMSFVSIEALGVLAVNDIWGWTDPENGKEYALVGSSGALSIVDITDAVNPVVVGTLPTNSGFATQRDVKVYADHAFVVSEASDHGMQVFDLKTLRTLTGSASTLVADTVYAGFGRAHNIVINEETGFGYAVGTSSGTCPAGLHMINLAIPDEPTYAGCFADFDTGGSIPGYTHDAQCVVYNGPDSEHTGKEICFAANVSHIALSDVSDKSAPVRISIATYPTASYIHQGWLSDDHRYFYQNDESDERTGRVATTRTLIWDLVDLDDPVLAGEHFSTVPSTDHNLYVVGSKVYQSNYTAGLRILDISDPIAPFEDAFFDVYPKNNLFGFDGSWSNYPFFESGNIIVTERASGLYVVRPASAPVAVDEGQLVRESLRVLGAYPNPFVGAVNVAIESARHQTLFVALYDILGRQRIALHGIVTDVGANEFKLDLHSLEAGTYFLRIDSDGASQTLTLTAAGN